MIVVAVTVGVVALTEEGAVVLGCEAGDMQAVSSGEVEALAKDRGSCQGSFSGRECGNCILRGLDFDAVGWG